ncbi:hypothetical protein ACFE04_011141 [Oxalis oulophora]
MDSKECWLQLAVTALTNLNIEKAAEVYSHIGDISNGNFDRAQELYMESDQPVEALNMRQDILQWDLALQLAKSLAPQQIPFICKEGRPAEALAYYEKGLQGGFEEKQALACEAGIARTSILCGDYATGLKIAMGSNSTRQLLNDCAELLDNAKKLNEAAQLYEMAENFNQAAQCYIRLKNWTKINSILSQVTSTKIHAQFAKAMEAIGNYRRAVNAYELARDFGNVIRITLERLHDTQEAVRIVQETRSIEGAKMVAKYFQKEGDFVSAVKFLIMSACYDDAFKLASNNDQLQLYGDLLVDEMVDGEVQNQFLILASHFESKSNSLLAGKYYYHGKQYRKAINNLLAAAKKNPQNEEALSLAIDVVAASQDDALTNQVIELLLGEVDGEARDPKYVFRLYMAKKQYLEAAKSAIIIAEEEQLNDAVPILTSTVIECHRANMKLSAFKFASVLMKPDYKQQIDEKYKKKIEGIIRKAPRGDQLSDEIRLEQTPCPGWHITKENITACPSCQFPAIYPELIE